MKYLSIETHGRKRRICFLTTSYAQNGNLAVLSYEENGEPFADVTVNFYFLEPGCAFIDTSTNAQVIAIIRSTSSTWRGLQTIACPDQTIF